MKRFMMIAAAALMAGMLFVACKNTPKATEPAAPVEPDLTAINAGDDLDWEAFSRYYVEEETPACCEGEEAAEEFAEEEIEEAEELAEEAGEIAEDAIEGVEAVEGAAEDLAEAVEDAVEAAEDEAPAAEYFAVAQKPGFNGGDANAFSKWVAANMTYPEEARVNDIEGTAVVKFTIGKDGAVRGAHIVKSSGNALLDAEAVRTISKAPNWAPGYDSEGKAVKTNLVMPVVFKLQH